MSRNRWLVDERRLQGLQRDWARRIVWHKRLGRRADGGGSEQQEDGGDMAQGTPQW
ncbi:hypothetical protein [Gemmatimonas sp. UBA7669]|uniref:hypothetical protein n=1 Tax=Gemmatimonas sp. UBA7669 TaxID=1946568 RepID=UPI0025BECB0E|nr:hypothetical protein [Gemmatimonas sp. UBA7669]